MRRYATGTNTAVDPKQDPQQEIYSCSQLAADNIVKYHTEKDNREQHKIYEEISDYFTRIIVAMTKVRDPQDLSYFANTMDSRLSMIERDPSYTHEYKSGFRELMQRFRERFESIKQNMAGLNVASGIQATGQGASQMQYNSLPDLDFKGGYYRSVGGVDGTPNVRDNKKSTAPKYINPQVSHLNLFLS